MFERFTEPARRTVFFARYEASQFGSEYIEPEHMLLGMLREGGLLKSSLRPGAADSIRTAIERRTAMREKIPTTVDLPLSEDAKRTLTLAEAEASELGHRHIDDGHLGLALLNLEGSMAKELLRKHGVEYNAFRDLVAYSRPDSPEPARQLCYGAPSGCAPGQ